MHKINARQREQQKTSDSVLEIRKQSNSRGAKVEEGVITVFECTAVSTSTYVPSDPEDEPEALQRAMALHCRIFKIEF